MKLHILILATAKPPKSLIKAIEERGHTFEWKQPDYLYLVVSESVNGYDSVFDGHPSHEKPIKLIASKYDCIITRIGKNLQYNASILRHLNENLKIYSTQSAHGLLTAQDKWKTHQRLSSSKIRTPKTIFANSANHAEWLIEQVNGVTCICKKIKGSSGNGVIIFESLNQSISTMEAFCTNDEPLILQKYVEGGSTDYRVWVIGNSVVLAMKRTAKENEFRANVSKNGEGERVILSKEDEAFCIAAAKSISLNFAGVDIIKGKDGLTYCIEINGCPGLKALAICNYNAFIDLVKDCEENSKKSPVLKNNNSMQDSLSFDNNVPIKKEVENWTPII